MPDKAMPVWPQHSALAPALPSGQKTHRADLCAAHWLAHTSHEPVLHMEKVLGSVLVTAEGG